MLNLRKAGDNSHVPAVWFAAEPEDKRSNIRFVFYQEGIDMAAKKGASKTTAKTTVQTPVKTAEEVTSAQTAKKVVANEKATEKKEEVKPAKVEAIETKAGKAKAIETKKDTTKAIETRAAVLQESEPAAEEKKTRARKTSAKTTTAAKTAVKCEMYLQFAGKEYAEKEILQMVKNVWTKELRNKVGDMKEVQIYLKPEESAAYYVINKETTGKIVL